MAFFDDFGKKINEFASSAVKKSGELVEVTKLNMAIKNEEEGIQKMYQEMGEYCFQQFEAGSNLDLPLMERCQTIKNHQKAISELKEKIIEVKNVIICPHCGYEMERQHAACVKCGAPNKMQEVATPVTVEKTCPQCQSAVNEGQAFCSNCGASQQ